MQPLTSELRMHRSSLSLPRCLYGFTHLRMHLHSTSNSTTGLQSASSIIQCKPRDLTSCTQPIKLLSTRQIPMSQALHDVIPVMNLLQEMRERDFHVICNEPYVCTARYLKTTQVLLNSQGFTSYVQGLSTSMFVIIVFTRKRLIKIFPIDTKDQIADVLTKPLAKTTFNIIIAPCVASDLSQATKVKECYEFRVLWYLLTVLTYHHVMTL